MGRRSRRLLRCSPTLACALALLSISLFSWGLAYKLSLYHSHQLPQMAAAKLLSQKERPATAQSNQLLPPIVPASPLNIARPPWFDLPGSTPAPRLELRSRHLHDAPEFFTVHTDRKPPPNVTA